MKILYGINGEGLGHLNRSRAVIELLVKEGHQVVIASRQSYLTEFLEDHETFEIDHIGLHFTCTGRVDVLRLVKDFWNLSYEGISGEYDLVISDYEPVSAKYARSNGIRLVTIDNQHRFSRIDPVLPWRLKLSNLAVKIVNRVLIGKADQNIISCFNPAEGSIPVICDEGTVADDDHVVVYLKDQYIDDFLNCYTPETDTYVFTSKYPAGSRGKIHFRELDTQHFKWLLRTCKAVVSNCGNQLIGECMYYGKPYTGIPIIGQSEQEINAFYMEYYGYGKVTSLHPSEFELNLTPPKGQRENGLHHVAHFIETLYEKEDTVPDNL